MQIRRMLLEGSPVIVARPPQERPSRQRMFCISSAHFRLTPLRRPMYLPVASTRSRPAPSPRRRWTGAAAPAPRRCPSRWTPGGNPYSFLPQPAQRLQHLGQRPAKRSSAATFTQWPGARASFRRFSPDRCQEVPLPTSSKTCSQSAKTHRCVLRLLASAPLAPGSGMTAQY